MSSSPSTEGKRFALIGAAGYIAPRHMAAIRDTGNVVSAAYDPNDSVGIMDSYFPDAHFFTEFERFDRHIDKLRRSRDAAAIEYVTVCSPNYLHDSHVRFALKNAANVVCEKPLVLNPWNIDGLIELEKDSGGKVNTILQLRLHPSIIELRNQVRNCQSNTKHDVELTYITSRGKWYFQSWKGDEKKSGGIATNIGVHFFDMLHFIYGRLQENIVHLNEPSRASGYLEYENARVRWYLSVNVEDVPADARLHGKRTYRALTSNGQNVEFSDGFTNLHNISYQKILAGEGFTLEDNRVAVETVSQIRKVALHSADDRAHPYVRGTK